MSAKKRFNMLLIPRSLQSPVDIAIASCLTHNFLNYVIYSPEKSFYSEKKDYVKRKQKRAPSATKIRSFLGKIQMGGCSYILIMYLTSN